MIQWLTIVTQLRYPVNHIQSENTDGWPKNATSIAARFPWEHFAEMHTRALRGGETMRIGGRNFFWLSPPSESQTVALVRA